MSVTKKPQSFWSSGAKYPQIASGKVGAPVISAACVRASHVLGLCGLALLRCRRSRSHADTVALLTGILWVARLGHEQGDPLPHPTLHEVAVHTGDCPGICNIRYK